MTHCANCNKPTNEKYCGHCGQPTKLERIDGHYIIHEIEHVLHFEKGILFTVRELLVRPGENIRRYITENRSRLVKPIIFIVITSLIYTLINHFFQIEEEYVQFTEVKRSTTGVIFEWIQSHYGYSNILMGIVIAAWTKLFFRREGYNFYEILILLCFAMGIGMLIFSIFAILQAITHIALMGIAGAAGLVYCVWAIGQFFEKKTYGSYFKAFAAYMLGTASFFGIAILSGFLIDKLIVQ